MISWQVKRSRISSRCAFRLLVTSTERVNVRIPHSTETSLRVKYRKSPCVVLHRQRALCTGLERHEKGVTSPTSSSAYVNAGRRCNDVSGYSRVLVRLRFTIARPSKSSTKAKNETFSYAPPMYHDRQRRHDTTSAQRLAVKVRPAIL